MKKKLNVKKDERKNSDLYIDVQEKDNDSKYFVDSPAWHCDVVLASDLFVINLCFLAIILLIYFITCPYYLFHEDFFTKKKLWVMHRIYLKLKKYSLKS